MNTALIIQDMEHSTELDQAALKKIIGGGTSYVYLGRTRQFMRKGHQLFRRFKKHYKKIVTSHVHRYTSWVSFGHGHGHGHGHGRGHH